VFSIGFWIFLAIFVGAFILNMPMPVGFMAATAFYLMANGLDASLLMEKMVTGLQSNYVLIAIPLFILSARIMNEGKITEKMFSFAKALVCHHKGGLAYVNVIASLIFSGMTGSALSDASGLGLMEIEEMRKDGYDDGFSCALTMTSATIGPIFPPSIPMVTYAMLSGVSVGALFMGGMVPGIVISIGLCLYISIIAKRRNYPTGTAYSRSAIVRNTLTAIPALLTPVILLGGIYTGVVTPTEAGALAGLYALMVSFLCYRDLGLKKVWIILRDSMESVGTISFLIATTYCISFVVSNENIPKMIAAFFVNTHMSKFVFLFVVNILFLFMGMFINTSTLQLVFLPIFIPIATLLGINLVHFGVIISLNLMIALSTPPYGTMLFLVAGLSKTKLEVIIKELWPQIAVLLGVLFLLTYVPEIILFLPQLAGLA